MRSLVVYDSNYGNTKSIAIAIAETLMCEAVSVTELRSDALIDIDLIILGSPINGWQPTLKMKTFLKSLSQLGNIKAAAFDTRMDVFYRGNAAKKISKALENAGAFIIAEPKGFFVKDKEGPLLDGELKNAQEWAKQILLKVK